MGVIDLLVIGMIALSVIVVFILVYLVRIINSPSGVLKLVNRDIDMMIKRQNRMIADMMIRLDVLSKDRGLGNVKSQIDISQGGISQATIRPQEQPLDNRGLVAQVLSLLEGGPMTSIQVQGVIKRTREHTARLLKKMDEQGLVERDSSKRPFVYKITEKGIQNINKT